MVLDSFAGTGTTAIACINLGRRYISIEKDPDYFKLMEERIALINKSIGI
jgi:DNA modification methylase